MMEMEGHMKTPVAQQWTNLIRFRSPDKLAAVITQTFLLIAAFMAILGFIYVICTVIIITIHHFLYDRDPNKIPDFVKNSVQFSSEDDDSDRGGGGEHKKNTDQVENSTNTKYQNNKVMISSELLTKLKSNKKVNIIITIPSDTKDNILDESKTLEKFKTREERLNALTGIYKAQKERATKIQKPVIELLAQQNGIKYVSFGNQISVIGADSSLIEKLSKFDEISEINVEQIGSII